MGDYAVRQIDDLESIYGGVFKRARAELGVSSFGIQVLDLPANEERYPEHDHAKDGQEEVYLALRGWGEIEIDGDSHPLDPDTLVRVGPSVTRKVRPGADGLRLLILGGVPGSVYQPPEISELGHPDPSAAAGS